MAKIPQAESRVQITSVSPTRRIGREALTGPSRITQALGKTLSEVSDRFRKAQTLNETTKAETLARKRLKELELEAEQTPDVFDIETFQKRFNDIKQESIKGITSGEARESFGNSFDRLSLMSDFSIRKILRKRQVDEMRATMFEGMDSLQDDPNRAEELDLLLQKNINSLTITKEDAFKLKKKALKSWQESDIRNAIATDVEATKKAILAGEFGQLSADETAKWLEVADQKEKRNKAEAEKARDTKWLVNGGNLVANLETIGVEDIIFSMTNGDIDPELGNDLIKWKTTEGTVQYQTKKDIWMNLIEKSVAPETDLREFQNEIGRAVANGDIQADEAAELSVQVKQLFEGAIAFKAKQNRFAQNMSAAIKMFKQSLLGPGVQAFFMTKELIDRVKNKGITDDKILDEANNIVEEKQAEINPNKARYKVGDKIDTPGGTVEIMGFDVDGEPLIKVVE